MCTVTLVPRVGHGGNGGPGGNALAFRGIDRGEFRGEFRGGVRMLCNRDESRARAAALPPTVRSFGERLAILPIDAGTGGTWVAVNDAGLAFTVLNRNPQDMRGIHFPGRHSRGTIIPALLDAQTLAEAEGRVRLLDAAAYPPFRLVVCDGVTIVVAVGEADALRVERLPLLGPTMFTSSGLGDALVEPSRRALFAAWFDGDAAHWESKQDAFHRHPGDPGGGELAVCMARDDARTVSLTAVEVTADTVALTYHGAPPSEPTAEVALSLPRVRGAVE